MSKKILHDALCAIACVIFSAHIIYAEEQQVSVTTVENDEISGQIDSWTSSEVVIVGDDASTTLSTEQLLAIHWHTDQPAEQENKAILELTDGTRLPFSEYKVESRQAEVTTPFAGEPLLIPISDIHKVQFVLQTQEIKQLWQQLSEKQIDGDVLVIRKEEAGALDYLTGVLGDVNSEQIVFNWDGDNIPVKRSKVAALQYYHAQESQSPAAVCWVTTYDGASIPVASHFVEGEHVQIKAISGLEFLVDFEKLQTADYSAGKLTYLSDLEPIKTEWTPRVELPASISVIREYGEPRRDQSFLGSQLSLAWPKDAKQSSRGTTADSDIKTYAKGLAVRSQTDLIYRLPREMHRFSTIAGIDPETASQGNVQLEIYADDVIVWQGEITGEADPVDIQFDLNGAEQLRIFVDYGANLDFGDRLHLVNARVTK